MIIRLSKSHNVLLFQTDERILANNCTAVQQLIRHAESAIF